MPRKSKVPLLLGGLGVALVLLYTQRKTVMLYGEKALQAGKEFIFYASLPDYAQPYGDIMLQVAREESFDPFLLFALGDRESRWGELLSPRGPAGTGDAGHGHGLMQIDDRSFASWLAANDWTDPLTNVRKGVQIWKQKMAFFQTDVPVAGLTDGVTVTIGTKSASKRNISPGQYPDPRPLQGDPLIAAATAAYNTGEGNVLMNLAAGLSPDATTTGGDYAGDVAGRAAVASENYDRAAAAV